MENKEKAEEKTQTLCSMLSHGITLLVLLVILVCVIYPLLLWGIGQTLFPFQANGSLVKDPQGNIIGSKLIAQSFTQDEYFHPRPSAANYNAAASASSALAASNPELRKRVEKLIQEQSKNLNDPLQLFPGDYVTTSASGLDPHITLQNAEFQLDRVVNAWSKQLKRDSVEIRNVVLNVLDQNAHAPLYGLIGEKLINVLEVNLELNKAFGSEKL